MITVTRNAAVALSAIPLALLVGCSSPEVESGDRESSTGVDGSSASASPSPSPDVAQVCETSSFSDPCTFGQTAIYSDTVDGEEMRLEITVLEPVAFTPTADALYFDNLATEKPALPVNVYFPVTITNVSPALDRESSFVFSQATNEAEGEYETLAVSDGEISSVLAFGTLTPGQSVTIRNGWSMSTLDGVELEIDIDGLQGYSITFAQ